MSITNNFKSQLTYMPDWAKIAIEKCGKPYEYIAYRLVNYHTDFNAVKKEIEDALPGTDINKSNFTLDALEQRVAFFSEAIKCADYFRPTSEELYKKLPLKMQPLKRPSAIDDLKFQTELKTQIKESSKSLASTLRQYGHVTQRLGLKQIACAPLELVSRAIINTPNHNTTPKWRRLFNQMQIQCTPCTDPTGETANLMDQLACIVDESEQILFTSKINIGMLSRKTTYYFYEAFNDWLYKNSDDIGGIIPSSFNLSDNCWAVLISTLTYNDVDQKSLQTYRSRSNEYIEKNFNEDSMFDLVDNFYKSTVLKE